MAAGLSRWIYTCKAITVEHHIRNTFATHLPAQPSSLTSIDQSWPLPRSQTTPNTSTMHLIQAIAVAVMAHATCFTIAAPLPLPQLAGEKILVVYTFALFALCKRKILVL